MLRSVSTLFLVSVVTVAGLVMTGCDPGGTTGTCGPQTCAGGCCDPSGVCQLGTTPLQCGRGGAACAACPTGQQCTLGVCGGGGTGCGQCPGCCYQGVCQSGTTDQACGIS